ncbi:hypothetical protein [uncultured Shewanella sp.]|uniref:hypothetical protein n=1 Tax=uncultured Shewanella sp. TaxID=173975 RepID=UPI0026079223|nr:hypothetical protein [uncultured Shewanella sp.]
MNEGIENRDVFVKRAWMALQRYPYLKASSASMPLVHKHRNQKLLFTVPKEYLHISPLQAINTIEAMVLNTPQNHKSQNQKQALFKPLLTDNGLLKR